MSDPLLVVAAEMDAPATRRFEAGEVAYFSATGPGKTVNEDALMALPLPSGALLLAIADGMGGLPGGERASRLALEALAREVEAASREGRRLRAGAVEGFEAANEAVRAEENGSGTTLVVALVEDGRVRPLHAGDSEAMLVGQRGRVKLRTVSHSPTGYAVQAGLLDELEALVHDERHLVSNVVGMEEMTIEVGARTDLARRDTLLLASDGLTDNLTESEVVETVRKGPLARAAGTLADIARGRMDPAAGAIPSKPDDLSFLLFRPSRRSPRPEAP